MNITWKQIIAYFISLDKRFGLKKLNSNRVQLTTDLKVDGREKVSYRFRLNKYLYYLELFYSIEFGEQIFLDEHFIALESGSCFEPILKEFTDDMFLELSKSDVWKELDEDVQTMIDNITFEFNKLTDDELIELNHKDPLWRMAWNNGEGNGSEIVSVFHDKGTYEYLSQFYGPTIDDLFGEVYEGPDEEE